MGKAASVKLLKKECALDDNGIYYDRQDGNMRWFVNPDYNAAREADRAPGSQVLIPLQDWEDMGSPRTLSVTILPWDKGHNSAEG